MPDLLGQMRLLMRRLQRALHAMIDADVRNTQERAGDKGRHLHRDQLTRRLQKTILRQRDSLRLDHGRKASIANVFGSRLVIAIFPLTPTWR